MSSDLTEEQLRALYAWIDAIPLSRPKRSITRDFADGVLFAEVVQAYFPQLVELHNYTPANATKQKIYNFETLNQRVLRKFGYTITRQVIEDIVNCKPGAVENVLNILQFKMAKYRERKAAQADDSSYSPSPQRKEPSGRSVTDNRTGSAGQQPYPPQQRQTFVGQQSAAGGGINGNLNGRGGKGAGGPSIDEEILLEKEQYIRDLQEQVEILELKIAKLEQLVRLKDNKIQKLMQR